MSRIESFNRIHILGASGSGTTSLAKALCDVLPHHHFDSDDYLWKTKFTETHPKEKRLELLRDGLKNHDNWILSGAIIDWGNPLMPLFDLVVFLSVPDNIRMERLCEREKKFYGDRILPGNDKYECYTEFIDWASRYEAGGTGVRSRKQQELWMANLDCPILRIEGDPTVEESVARVLDYIQKSDK